jgi:hypothetical protein
MNYIKQLTGFFEQVAKDHRLNPTHVSLYMALFQYWNLNRFKSPISISRSEIMGISKIGSNATYHKCIKDLHNYGYIRYEPSYNPFRGSWVYLFNFQTGDESRPVNQVNSQTGIEPAINRHQTGIEPAVVPSINNSKEVNKVNYVNECALSAATGLKNGQVDEMTGQRKEKGCAEKEKKGEDTVSFLGNPAKAGEGIPPSLEAVQDFFYRESYPKNEALKFFHYFQSNGWKVGGKTPMQNWRSAAHNWMLNALTLPVHATHSSDYSANRSPGHLHAGTGKDYSEPL